MYLNHHQRVLDDRGAPLVIAIDGRRGVEKSTIALQPAAVWYPFDDCTILVEAPAATRRERLALREAADFLDAWHRRWDAAQHYFFTEVRPGESFDVVVDGVTSRVRMR